MADVKARRKNRKSGVNKLGECDLRNAIGVFVSVEDPARRKSYARLRVRLVPKRERSGPETVKGRDRGKCSKARKTGG